MNEQTKCPFCGAGKATRDFVAVYFDCLTAVPHEHPKSARFQSAECRAKARLDEIDRLRERVRRLEEAGDKMVEAYSCDALNAWEKAKESHP